MGKLTLHLSLLGGFGFGKLREGICSALKLNLLKVRLAEARNFGKIELFQRGLSSDILTRLKAWVLSGWKRLPFEIFAFN